MAFQLRCTSVQLEQCQEIMRAHKCPMPSPQALWEKLQEGVLVDGNKAEAVADSGVWLALLPTHSANGKLLGTRASVHCTRAWFLIQSRAAYKGFADCIRLLLFLDAHRSLPDKEVTLQAQREYPHDMISKDKFLLQSTVVPSDNNYDIVPHTIFNKDSGRVIEECKLRVVFLSPNSPQGDDDSRKSTKQSPDECTWASVHGRGLLSSVHGRGWAFLAGFQFVTKLTTSKEAVKPEFLVNLVKLQQERKA